MDYVILVLPGLVVIGILWWTQRRMNAKMKRAEEVSRAEYERKRCTARSVLAGASVPRLSERRDALDRPGPDRTAGAVVGQSRRARRLVQVAAERFIRAYIIPILDWVAA